MCSDCEEATILYCIYFVDDHKVLKAGQYPSSGVALDPLLAKKITNKEYIELLKKGLKCERHGFGIAAYSYYRRILEDCIDSLISEIIESEEDQSLRDHYYKASKQKNAADKIKLIREKFESSIVSTSDAYLNILYQFSSEVIHNLSDKEALSYATLVRESISNLLAILSTDKSMKETLRINSNILKERLSKT